MPSRTREQRVAEYVDSPLLFHRLKLGAEILCEVNGHEGVYLTRATVTSRGAYSCSCPSDIDPCKHVEALRETFGRNPTSFYDAAARLAVLARGTQEELVDSIRALILDSPGVLRTLDRTAFEDEDENVPGLEDEE